MKRIKAACICQTLHFQLKEQTPTVEKILCRSPISKRSPLSDFRQTKKQRETGVKRVETAGVYPLAHRRGTANSPLNLSEKLSALIERIACAFDLIAVSCVCGIA